MSAQPEMLAVLISLDYRSMASYTGGVPGLAPTSPSVTGQRLGSGTPAERAYEDYIVRLEQEFSTALSAAVPEARITRHYRAVFGGVAAVVPADRVDRVRSLPHVTDVQPDRARRPDGPGQAFTTGNRPGNQPVLAPEGRCPE